MRHDFVMGVVGGIAVTICAALLALDLAHVVPMIFDRRGLGLPDWLPRRLTEPPDEYRPRLWALARTLESLGLGVCLAATVIPWRGALFITATGLTLAGSGLLTLTLISRARPVPPPRPGTGWPEQSV